MMKIELTGLELKVLEECKELRKEWQSQDATSEAIIYLALDRYKEYLQEKVAYKWFKDRFKITEEQWRMMNDDEEEH